ncbi:cadherin-23-like isoform X2 [Lineus longissimus]|uniref:cadherin-23-like isoform X2 n=1 Tax=Lineus longissimus TaxID=88925 RepID=UPI002B4F2E8C
MVPLYKDVLIGIAAFLCLVTRVSSNNPPTIIGPNAPVTEYENIPVGKVLFTLTARDSDDSRVTFSTDPLSPDTNELVTLVQTGKLTAQVKLKKKLDRETKDQYELKFQATDSASNKGVINVNLIVFDVNDNAPEFQGSYVKDVPENTPVGTVIFDVTATDKDTGAGGSVTYKLAPGESDMFTINAASGAVKLAKPLDYETKTTYNIKVIASDSDASNPLSTPRTLVVNVKDVQDTAPLFLNLPYAATIVENLAAGSSVFQVTAIDGDKQVPNKIKYSLNGAGSEKFDIGIKTGLITVKVPPNREDSNILANNGVLSIKVKAEEVTTNPQGVTTAETTIQIKITDVNDETPTFNQPSFTGKILENSQPGSLVTFIPTNTEMSVTDKDQGINAKFKLEVKKGGKGYGTFEVVPTIVYGSQQNVQIKVKNSTELDFEKVKELIFDVVATETDTTEKRTSKAAVKVIIEDANDNYPVFAQKVYKANIPENSAKGTKVITITATDKDTGVFGQLKYSLKGAQVGNGFIEDYRYKRFVVNENTGEITTSKDAIKDKTILDRETINTYYITYEATDGGNSKATTMLEISLTDQNDNPPIFVRNSYEGHVKEGDTKLEREVKVEATDRDLGPVNNKVVYSITGGDPKNNFTIDPNTGIIGLNGPLDIESMDPSLKFKYNLTVTATDKGTPPLSNSVHVVITVQDKNDNTPYFTSCPNASIPESTKPGAKVSRVEAKDDDMKGSINSEVLYRIDSGGSDKFRVDGTTGQVTVETGANLDRDLFPKEYNVKMLVIDRGTPSRTGSCVVTITITDVNNKPPIFNPTSKRIKVLENVNVGHLVDTFTATDSDENADIEYSILLDKITAEDENGQPVIPSKYNFKGLFKIDPKTGKVTVANKLDREAAVEIRLAIKAVDRKAPDPNTQTALGVLDVVVQDVNDNPPIFKPSKNYIVQLYESAATGAEVTTVLAIDLDQSTTVRYEIDQDQSHTFEFKNPGVGTITLKKTLDREQNEWLNFTVKAIDSGKPPETSVATVSVHVQDINDNSPVFLPFKSVVEVSEDASVGLVIANMSAVDKDQGSYAKIFYTLNADKEFTINSATGVVTLYKKLDRERKDTYTLTITAADNNNQASNGVEPRTKEERFTVKVLDVNDQTPTFTKPVYTHTVQETAPLNQVFVTYTATDKDIADNAKLTYSFDAAGSNGTAVFAINAVTGGISPKKPLTENIGCYKLKVVATDHGKTPNSGSTLVNICIEDLNNNPPRIIEPPLDNATFSVVEGQKPNISVTQVKATDPDTSGTIRFKFSESVAYSKQYWKEFNIDSVTGKIIMITEPDHERIDEYFLQVIATDGVHETRRDIKVKIDDIDDNLPMFDTSKIKTPFEMSVQEEGIPANGIVGTVPSAIDLDSNLKNNSLICYYIVGGDPDFYFRLNRETRVLTITKKIDRESSYLHGTSHVDLVIKAMHICSDSYDREKASTIRKRRAITVVNDLNRFKQVYNASDKSLLPVVVNVHDINDNPPKFRIKDFSAGVTRDTQVYSTVMNFAPYVIDKDIGPNAVITYEIKDTIKITPPELKEQIRARIVDYKVFILNHTTGILKTNMFFQDNMQGYFKFTVIAKDSAGHMDSAHVWIYMLNANQRLKGVFRADTEAIGKIKDEFAAFLSNIIKARINVDMITTHKDDDGKSNDKLTDLFFHAVNNSTGEIMPARTVLDLIDQNYDDLIKFFNKYNIIKIVLAVPPVTEKDSVKDFKLALGLVAIILGIFLIVTCLICFCCRRKYKRKLRAATAMAFGSKESGLNRLEMPGTNLHTYEGSNPIWLETYQNNWAKEEDQDSKNSLDDNVIEPSATKTYDEQEITLDLFNDEYDGFNKVPELRNDGDTVLAAAIKEHEHAKNRRNNDLNQDYRKPDMNSKSPVVNGYTNFALEPDSAQNNNIGLETTDI